ncbi:MAG: GntR family transcriptional regulator [Kiritimatiellae bacterium]|nr:GntR family transcriptional regulator [Kiritimatiellia bacterium]
MTRHDEIFERLRREILAGKFDSGRRLPSEAALSRRFGVSRPTISRVTLDLRREGLIVTRQGAATLISRFALNATGALGLVVPGESYTEIFPPLCDQIVRLAEQSGWDVIHGEIKSSNPQVRAREARRLAYQFSKERVSGIFFQPLEFVRDFAKASAEVISYFDAASIPVVLLDYDIVPPPERSDYDLVGIDNVSAGLAVGRALVRAGARRLAFLLRPGAAPTVADRLRGVASAAIEAGGTWSLAENVLVCEPDDVRAVAWFLKRHNPDAIVSGNDIAAARLRETLLRIGGDAARIRLAGFDDVAVAAKIGITTVHQPCGALAEIALQTLLSRIRSPRLPARTILLPAPLVVR